MRHAVNKIKFKNGQDANEMLMKKLAYNFFSHGKIVTTETKIKALKPLIERLAYKLTANTESNRNFIMRYLPKKKMVETMYEQAGPKLKERTGGYTRLVKLYQRTSDATMVARLEWTDPVVVEWTAKKVESEVVEKPVAPKRTRKAKTESKLTK